MLSDFQAEHAPLIHKQANILKSKGKIPPNIDIEELHSEGFHGLMDAFHKYDPDVASRMAKEGEENPFLKYAEKRIKYKMQDYMAAKDEIPKNIRTRAKNLELLDKPEAPSVTPSLSTNASLTPKEPNKD